MCCLPRAVGLRNSKVGAELRGLHDISTPMRKLVGERHFRSFQKQHRSLNFGICFKNSEGLEAGRFD
jgi:hypothetical protein